MNEIPLPVFIVFCRVLCKTSGLDVIVQPTSNALFTSALEYLRAKMVKWYGKELR